MTMNQMDVIHMLIYCIYLFLIESGIFVSVVSTVCEYTNGSTKKYRYALAVYLITVLSSSYVIIMDSSINAPGHEKNVVDVLNATEKN